MQLSFSKSTKFSIKPPLIELINAQIKCVVELIDNVCLYLISEHINFICFVAFFVLSSIELL